MLRPILLVAALAGVTACTAPSTVGVAVDRVRIAIDPRPEFWLEAPITGDPSPFLSRVPRTGAVVEGDRARLLRPSNPSGARRVAIQAGHWKTAEAPAEFPKLAREFGTSFDGVDEVDVNLDIARRVATLLTDRGLEVEVLPAVIPPGYLADVFVALHADGDEARQARGFKIAHGFYRGPQEDVLVNLLAETYASHTGLPSDEMITENMTDYYAFAWYRYEHALAPHTAAAVLEMGFLSDPQDRELLLEQPDVVAGAVADGIVRFLAAVPRAELFGRDIVVPITTPERLERP